MFAFLSALVPALDYDAVYATPSSLKEWVHADGAHRGPRSRVAGFAVIGAAPVAAGSARELLHQGGAMTCVSVYKLEGAC